MTIRPEEAWDCFLRAQKDDLLQLMADECYSRGGHHFLFAAKSFNELLNIDSFPDYVDGFAGACAGYFRYVLAKKEKSGEVRQLSTS
mmetsp:Transcript_32243/g.55027  ORF Transcript_32243/g.55027 Transcript_32243/m.55027 type:complete len:87 (-) Transcript_32243:197-457(-)